ncbi:hypothetical protein C8034_v012030 [Colletotrichum sidae]|uniref:Protein NO VEIN C-terminal domain-containing protein n=1 Tax=Colletotrichum sidae TaxID=1347389 RepID=A0A4V3I387_9PEZI|nr:hypothetical protein C8034_v012030 [Colletotrichum sidae]
MEANGEHAGEPAARSPKQVVDDIANKLGYLSASALPWIGEKDEAFQKLRRSFELAILERDRERGGPVLGLAKGIGSSKTQFVFELLQNSDNSSFDKVEEAGDDPAISFKLFDDRLVVESNEDGFTQENVEALCAVGKSTNQDAPVRGYVGDPGIGFKSVFKVAWKAYIQSNGFSFSFVHRKEDSGLGMITPIWEDEGDAPGDGITRITLFLHDDDDSGRAKSRKDIEEELGRIEDTFLLFFQSLRHVHVSFYDEDEALVREKTYSRSGSNPTILRTDSSTEILESPSERPSSPFTYTTARSGEFEGSSTTSTESAASSERRYHVVKHVARNLPPKDAGDSGLQDGLPEPRSNHSAEVVLAFKFPLTDESTPDDPGVYSFFPLQSVGIRFLIQADFVTQDDGRTIAPSSDYNRELLKAVAACFFEAARTFCDDPYLQYRWMRWLPPAESFSRDSPWHDLIDALKASAKEAEVIRTRDTGKLTTIASTRRVTPDWCDELNDPLFPDPESKVYVAAEYQTDDLDLLYPYGLNDIDLGIKLDLIEHDLRKSRLESWLKNGSKSEDWHSRVNSQLHALWEAAEEDDEQSRIRKLPLIPLEGGRWGSASTGDVYFSRCAGDLHIPGNLGLKLVRQQLPGFLDDEDDKDGTSLLQLLGVKTAAVAEIRQRIFEQPTPSSTSCQPWLEHINCLEYLYLSDARDTSEDDAHLFANVHVYDQQLRMRCPRTHNVYLETSGRYSPKELLGPSYRNSDGFQASFLHSDYFEDVPRQPDGSQETWVEWLQRRLRLRTRLDLPHPTSPEKLSDEFDYVRTSQPEVFVEALIEHWDFLDENSAGHDAFIQGLKDVEVLCADGKMHRLSDTFMPLLDLRFECREYIQVGPMGFKFLEGSETIMVDANRPKWAFLVDVLSVNDSNGIDFYLSLLDSLRRSSDESQLAEFDVDGVFKLYDKIHDLCQDSAEQDTVRTKVRRFFFEGGDYVYVAAENEDSVRWCHPADCVWAAPVRLMSKNNLEPSYSSKLGRDDGRLDKLREFFETTLDVKDDLEDSDALDELDWLRDNEVVDLDRIIAAYKLLDQRAKGWTVAEAKAIRRRFRDRKAPLIFVETNDISGWYASDQCLWCNAPQMHERLAIESLYIEEQLEDFFLTVLKVPRLTLEMAYDELLAQDGNVDNIDEVKRVIWEFNAVFGTGTLDGDQRQKVLESRIFPVNHPSGDRTLDTAAAQFAITDHKALSARFGSEVKVLDFTLDQVRKLKDFFQWLGLEPRYLSASVKKVSTGVSGTLERLRDPARDVNKRAKSILRLAIHFNSPLAKAAEDDLYQTLLGAEVWEASEITSELQLVQDDEVISVPIVEIDGLHVEDDPDLRIFVPRNPQEQTTCYFLLLPGRLLEWIMTDPSTGSVTETDENAVKLMSLVLNTPKRKLAQLLEEEGVADDDDVGEDDSDELLDDETLLPEDPVPDAPSPDTAIPDLKAALPDLLDSTPDELVEDGLSEFLQNVTRAARAATFPSYEDVYRVDHPDPSLANGTKPKKKKNKALKTAKTKTKSASPAASTPPPTLSTEPTAVPYECADERAIGAAGELFAFELFSNLGLGPAFDRDSWQSKIRKLVRAHPEYSDMEPWRGSETADIVFRDAEHRLTDILAGKGHLHAEDWDGKTPTYMIEVKGTRGDASHGARLSKAQFSKIKEHTSEKQLSVDSPKIEILVKVFNIGQKDEIGVNVYVDPEHLRQHGRMHFTEDQYLVSGYRPKGSTV